MSAQTDNQHKKTQVLTTPISAFKNPFEQGQEQLKPISVVRFVLHGGQTVDVDAAAQPYMVLGRQEGNERRVDVDLSRLGGHIGGVSRTHALVQVSGDTVFVRDFNSRNGTFLNGQELYPMRDYRLKDGDELKLGRVKVHVRII